MSFKLIRRDFKRK